MGHHNSKISTIKSNLQPYSHYLSLQRAVLYKRASEVRSLLSETDDINETGEKGLSLLHLAILPKPPGTFHAERYYEFLFNSDHNKLDNIRDIIAILCERGARLTQDDRMLNPIEALHYCSAGTNPCLQLIDILINFVDLYIDNSIRFSVWNLVHHRFKSVNGNYPEVAYSKWGPVDQHCHVIALFVKHGIIAHNYFTGITAPFSYLFKNCFEFVNNSNTPRIANFSDSRTSVCYCTQTENSCDCTFEHTEFMINIWQHLWNFNDPLSIAFDLPLITAIIENSTKHGYYLRTKLIIELLITSWLKVQPYQSEYTYTLLSTLLNIFIKYTKYLITKEDLMAVINFSLLSSFVNMTPDVILVNKDKNMVNKSIEVFVLLLFSMHQLLVTYYGTFSEIPYYELEVFSISLNKVFVYLPASHFYNSKISFVDVNEVCHSFDKRELSGFIARFDNDINVRNANTGRTLLQHWLLYGDIYMVQTLIESGASPFTVDSEGNSFIDQINSIIYSFRIGPARQAYEGTRDKYVILNKPYPLLTLAANVIVRKKVPFNILNRQPRIYNMLLHYLPP
ncbi:hypothetical protein LOD99_12586 [Oopsacas minuta]|uniref:Uncharacterized protein n=1 Tax=Oopsacas minuta TaxID=111878 RepID=A0AAV7JCM3_9METZ|nr:hypothetical protein LOD99_12586 [Oopsacas minuta]